jgi:putative glutamine amidotransferase
LTTYLQQAQTGVWDVRASFLPAIYLEGVNFAGGIAVLLPPQPVDADVADRLLDGLDGLIITGGRDVDPSAYGQQPHGATDEPVGDNRARDALEFALVRGAVRRGMPVLGICRGSQVLAVADGGTLTQDVHTLHAGAHTHTYQWAELALLEPGDHWHEVVPVPGSKVERWLAGGPARVNSFHHQCVATTGGVLRPAARTLDGVIEATERADGRGWAAGLQWHNEMMWPHDERFLRPFADFVAAAGAYASERAAATAA